MPIAANSHPTLRLPLAGLMLARSRLALTMGSLLPLLWATPAESAERLYLSYGVLERSISLPALAAYAKTGVLDEDLYVYSQYVKDPKILADIRKVLVSPADLSPVAVSQFLYTPQGEILLKRLGQVIQPESRDRDSAFYAIRAALILASADKQGLSPLNVLQKFPTRGIRIDLLRSLDIARALEQLVTRTNQITDEINQQATQAAANQPPLPPLPDLALRGPLTAQKTTINLVDNNRQTLLADVKPSPGNLLAKPPRIFPVDIYFPVFRSRQDDQPGTVPVVVISHGLGSDLATFAYLAEHLASHGFIVVVPEHPGSNAKQIQGLLSGTVTEIAEPREFVDRPLDIKFLLDELTKKAALDPRYAPMNLQKVGVLGQSFGGYTAFALAGAPINFAQLQTDCVADKLDNTLNISLALQCQAEKLIPKDYQLGDPRVQAIMAINPINSAVLGSAGLSQIQIPTMMVSGNADTVAPALPEQIIPFSWLQTRDRYFVMINRGTHFSVLSEVQNDNDPLRLPPEVLGESPGVARRYMSSLSLAFFGTHIANQATYRPYLSATYTKAISQDPINLSLVNTVKVDK
jgi:predicted dienelactone hydrolase